MSSRETLYEDIEGSREKVTVEIDAIPITFDLYRRHERYCAVSLSRNIRYPRRDMDRDPFRRFVVSNNQVLDVGANIDFIDPICSRRSMRVDQSLPPQFLSLIHRSRRWLPTASCPWFRISSDPSTHYRSSTVISTSGVGVSRGQTVMHNHAQRDTASLPAPCHSRRDFWQSAAWFRHRLSGTRQRSGIRRCRRRAERNASLYESDVCVFSRDSRLTRLVSAIDALAIHSVTCNRQ